MKVLHLCLSLYDFWTTYEGEYLNESLLARKDVDLKVWGGNRVQYNDKLGAMDVIKHLYGNDYPDIVIVHSTMEKHETVGDRKIFQTMEDVAKKSILVWRTFDCFDKNLPFYVDQVRRFKPQIVLNWYKEHVNSLRSQLGNSSKIVHFPHSVGRRYINKMSARPFDIALIGRCENNGSTVEPQNFADLRAYRPPKRSTRAEKGGNLISDLNQCRFSWNSPVKGRLTSLRFFESPACGTISMIPEHFSDLDLYFPKDTYMVCNSSFKKAIDLIKRTSANEFNEMQARAYKCVMSNHTMDRRVAFLMEVIKGKDVSFRDFYG